MQASTRRDGRVASQAGNRAWLAPLAAVALVTTALTVGACQEAAASAAGTSSPTALAAGAPRSDSILPQRKIVWPARPGRPQAGTR